MAHCVCSHSIKKHLKCSALPVMIPAHHLRKKLKHYDVSVESFSRPVSYLQRCAHKNIHPHTLEVLERQLAITEELFYSNFTVVLNPPRPGFNSPSDCFHFSIPLLANHLSTPALFCSRSFLSLPPFLSLFSTRHTNVTLFW